MEPVSSKFLIGTDITTTVAVGTGMNLSQNYQQASFFTVVTERQQLSSNLITIACREEILGTMQCQTYMNINTLKQLQVGVSDAVDLHVHCMHACVCMAAQKACAPVVNHDFYLFMCCHAFPGGKESSLFPVILLGKSTSIQRILQFTRHQDIAYAVPC